MYRSIFGSNKPYVLAILIGPIALLGLAAYHSSPPDAAYGGLLFDLLHRFLAPWPLLLLLLGMSVHMGTALIINATIRQYALHTRENYLPALCYFMLVGLLPVNLYLNPVALALLFVVLALRMSMNVYRSQRVNAALYNSGFMLGLAGLAFPPALLAAPIPWLALLILRPFDLREWLVPATGILTPMLYAWSYYYWHAFHVDLQEYAVFKGAVVSAFFPTSNRWIVYSLWLVSTVVGLVIFLGQIGHATVQRRNSRTLALWAMILLAGCYLYTAALEPTAAAGLQFLAAPVALLCPVLFLSSRRVLLVSILFALWLLAGLILPLLRTFL